jgi:hypothetical protein
MEIEKTSQIIKSMIEECYDEDDSSTDINSLENWEEKMKFMFTSFAYNKKLTIDYSNVKDFLYKFNAIYKSGYFASFKPPIVQEYFCKQLNFLLIIDFILTFFRVDDKKFDVKKINTQFVFDFFIRLGDFYNFMNYLDVDEHFVNYLKYMLILYAFQLDRNVIEEKYHYFVCILDNFLQNDIMPQIFKDIHYKRLDALSNQINEYNKKFAKEIKEYDNSHCYYSKEYEYLDDLFIMNNYWNSLPSDVTTKTKKIEVLNPNPPPPMHNIYTNALNGDNNDDDNDDDDDNYDDDDDDDYEYQWTPTISKYVPIIEKEDANYEEYRKLFILRNYQKIKEAYDNIMSEVNAMCSSLHLKKYDKFEPDNKNIEIMKVKTILGCVLDYNSISNNDYDTIFGLASEYGHIEIVKALLEKKNGDIGGTNFEKAQASPNRDIPRYLAESKSRLKKLNELFTRYKDVNYYEPKIRFN